METRLITSQQIAPIDKEIKLYTSHDGELTSPNNRVVFGVLLRKAKVVAVIPIKGKTSITAFQTSNFLLKTVKVKTYDAA